LHFCDVGLKRIVVHGLDSEVQTNLLAHLQKSLQQIIGSCFGHADADRFSAPQQRTRGLRLAVRK
jgi:hypothetical protein